MTTEYLLERELELVLAALMPTNRLICRVCLHTGLRLGDVLALRTDCLKTRFTIMEGKTGKARRVSLPWPLVAEIRAQAGPVYVFPGAKDRLAHRTRQAVYKDLKRAAAAFRLTQNVAPHSLRKVYAVRLLEKYGNLERVRRALNHGSLAVTMLYAMADKALEARKDSKGRVYRALQNNRNPQNYAQS